MATAIDILTLWITEHVALDKAAKLFKAYGSEPRRTLVPK